MTDRIGAGIHSDDCLRRTIRKHLRSARTRDVVLGVTNPQVMVRRMAVANLAAKELRKSLAFQVKDALPRNSSALILVAVIPFGDTISVFGEDINLFVTDLNVGALFVLAQNEDPRARAILLRYAKGEGNPDLQLDAIRYLISRRDQTTISPVPMPASTTPSSLANAPMRRSRRSNVRPP